MLKLLKVFLRGIITTLALPLIVLVWVIYGVYCIGLFIFMFFKGVVDFFQGKDFNGDLPEDLEARRMVLEKEKTDEQAKQVLNVMYENALSRPVFNENPTPEPQETMRPFGPEAFTPEEGPISMNEDDNNEELTDDIRSI